MCNADDCVNVCCCECKYKCKTCELFYCWECIEEDYCKQCELNKK